jgi:RNA polymerase sigma factor (sigma-70 family)
MAGDARLLRASLRGDHDAFARIVRHYQALICAITYSTTGDFAASEDLAQETFLTAWKGLGSVREPSRLRAWLCGIARNLTAEHLRRRQHDVDARAASLEDVPAVESDLPTPIEQATAEEREHIVWDALREIPEAYRVPLILYYRQEQSTRRVARDLQISRAAVRQRLARGRGMLRDRIAALVGDTLSSTAPGSTFAAAVLAAVAGTAARKGAGIGSTILGLSLAKAAAVAVLAVGAAVGAAVALRPDAPEPVSVAAIVPVAAPAPEPAEHAAEGQPGGIVVRGVVVDEEGAPVPGALVNALGHHAAPADATATEDGSFALYLEVPRARYVVLLASADRGRLQGLYEFGHAAASDGPVRVVLRPAARLTVTARDLRGEPVPGARVEAIHSCDTLLPLPSAETSEAGRVDMLVPAGAQIRWVMGAKPGVGFDYFENYRSWPAPREVGVPESADLILDGISTVRVTAVGSAGELIGGVPFVPWIIKKRGKVGRANLSGSVTFVVEADAAGVAVFDWIPPNLAEGISFFVRGVRFHCPDLPRLDPADPVPELTAVLLRRTPIRGRILLPDGSPSVGTLVQAEGKGNTNHYCRGYARTADDGSYSMLVYPEQSYIIAVVDEQWAASSKTDVVVHEGLPVEDMDFRLGAGTVIRGAVRIGREERPAEGETVTLIEQGPPLPEELRADHGENRARLVRWTATDESGRYSFRVGRGKFTLKGPGYWDQQDLSITGGAELVRDFFLEGPDRGALTGRVVYAGDGRPAAGATVKGEGISSRARPGRGGFVAMVDEDGAFRTERWRDRLVLYARSEDGMQAAMLEISEDEPEVTIRLFPAATFVGKVVDQEGQPLPNRKVCCTPELPWIDGRFTLSLAAETDEDGRFSLAGIVDGTEWTTRVITDPPDPHARATMDVIGPVTIEVPNLVVRRDAE